ncbi:MAG: MgtC/SapB family protein [Gemmatimonadota bacterium]
MTPSSNDLEMLLRLGGATLAGSAIGINREITHKPAGLRTHALVALGAAVMTLFSVNVALASGNHDQGAVLRTIQGIITGIGFIGGGVVLRNPREQTVRGLTTAASIWIVAALGMACGMGEWKLVLLATVLALCVLIGGRGLEERLHRLRRHSHPPAQRDAHDREADMNED